MVNYYELLVVIPTTQTDEEIVAAVDRVAQILTESGAEIKRREEVGKFRLTYPIRHLHHGSYHLFVFITESGAVRQINDKLRLSSGVIRFEISRSTPTAVGKRYFITQYQEPLVDRGEREVIRPRIQRPRTAPVPIQSIIAPTAEPLSTEEIDKQIDKILEEKII